MHSRSEEPHFGIDAMYVTEAEVARALGERHVVVAHVTGVSGCSEEPGALDTLELAPEDAPSLAIRGHEDLGRAVKAARSARGKHGALDPLLQAA